MQQQPTHEIPSVGFEKGRMYANRIHLPRGGG